MTTEFHEDAVKRAGKKDQPIRARFTYLLDVMLRRRGFSYSQEFIDLLHSDLTEPKNMAKLQAFFRLLPYIAVKFTDAEIREIEDINAKLESDRKLTLTKQEDKAEDLNRIMILEKEKTVAVSGIKN